MCQCEKKSLRNDNESLQEQKDTNNLLYICRHLRSGRHFLSSSRHHTQSVEGEHTQLPGAHSRLYKAYKKINVSGKKAHTFSHLLILLPSQLQRWEIHLPMT